MQNVIDEIRHEIIVRVNHDLGIVIYLQRSQEEFLAQISKQQILDFLFRAAIPEFTQIAQPPPWRIAVAPVPTEPFNR